MRIFWYEFRKLFRPAALLAAAAVLLLLRQSTLGLCDLPGETGLGCTLDIYEGWKTSYGRTIDPEELPGLQAQLDALYAEADETIARWDESKWAHWDSFSDAGVTNYKEYLLLLEKTERSPVENNVAALLLDSRTDFLQERINLVKNVLEMYDFEQRGSLPGAAEAHSAALERSRILAGSPEIIHSTLNSQSIYYAYEFAAQLALTLVLVLAIVISPGLVQEKLCRMTQLQWTTSAGRKIAYHQLGAVLAFSALVSVAMVVFYGGWFCRSWRAGVFWDCMAYAVGGSQIPWFDFTYGQYLLILAAVVVAVGIAAGAVMFFLSQFSAHYIAMLLKALPAGLAMIFLSNKILSNLLYFGNALSGLTGVPGTELLLTAGLLAASLALVFLSARQLQSREL
ncbi:MAG: hypothetical protein HFH26_06815 [Clostridiaceae bacterium]|nr:hypothetical protein [Clostridiaceae bacterium]